MNLLKLAIFSFLIFALGILSTCKDREANNPFDTACPKELFTPSDFRAEQQGTAVKLTWVQKNNNISGFVINRNENDGTMAEVDKVDKSITLWSDNNIVGGKKYGYQLVAYAGENLSNLLQVFITPVTGATVVTASAATGITPYSVVLGGTITSDGGAVVTERGICYGTAQNPTIANTKLAIGTGIGEFSGTITGLIANTTYYAKAYSTNSQGTTYGNQISFNTPALLLSVTPAIYDVPKESGSRVFTVTSNIDWQVSSDQSWCKPNVNSGKGNGSVIAAFETNASIGQRSAALTFSAVGVSNQIVIITQAGTEPPALSIMPSNQNVTNAAGTTTFAITSNVAWTATIDQTWCTITNTSGIGNSTLTINYETNTTNSKRIGNLSVTGLGLSAKTVNITQQSAIPTQGLVSYYPFNGNANDESGNGNNGTVNGPILADGRKGNANSAYSFDGQNDELRITTSNGYPQFGNPQNSFSLVGWFKTTSTGFIYQNGSNNGWHGIEITSGGKLRFWVCNSSWNSDPPNAIFSNLAYNDNIWHFFAATLNNNKLSLYVDNTLLNTSNFNGSLLSSGGWDAGIAIGFAYKHEWYLKGIIDDIRIYNRALSETEIQQLYNE